ncbi:MAG: hypothetical protein M0C28_17685 [Candidatus Moduliflexus flocculans]|nr:hypothetical protein [Candidatus Moduliflexus flocculans]
MEAAFSDGHATVVLYDDGLHGDAAANDGLYATTWTPTTVNELTITVTASQAAYGSVSRSISGQVRQRIADTWTVTDYAWIDAQRRYALYPGR